MFLSKGVEDGYVGEGAGWGASDGDGFGGLMQLDTARSAAFHEEAAEKQRVTIEYFQYVERGLIMVCSRLISIEVTEMALQIGSTGKKIGRIYH